MPDTRIGVILNGDLCIRLPCVGAVPACVRADLHRDNAVCKKFRCRFLRLFLNVGEARFCQLAFDDLQLHPLALSAFKWCADLVACVPAAASGQQQAQRNDRRRHRQSPQAPPPPVFFPCHFLSSFLRFLWFELVQAGLSRSLVPASLRLFKKTTLLRYSLPPHICVSRPCPHFGIL